MKTTRYFVEQVLRKRPYIEPGWCAKVLANPIRRRVQADGRSRIWGTVLLEGEETPRFLRIVVLADGETVHNAFFDRGYREDEE